MNVYNLVILPRQDSKRSFLQSSDTWAEIWNLKPKQVLNRQSKERQEFHAEGPGYIDNDDDDDNDYRQINR